MWEQNNINFPTLPTSNTTKHIRQVLRCISVEKFILLVSHIFRITVDMRHIQYLAQTLPLPLVLTSHLILGKFHIQDNRWFTLKLVGQISRIIFYLIFYLLSIVGLVLFFAMVGKGKGRVAKICFDLMRQMLLQSRWILNADTPFPPSPPLLFVGILLSNFSGSTMLAGSLIRGKYISRFYKGKGGNTEHGRG